tara:strand:+ start:68 stop:262 length:195 start_codon:yes stop_codon:yes gene_type:complete
MERKTCTFRIRKDVHQAVKETALRAGVSFETVLEMGLLYTLPRPVRISVKAAIKADARAERFAK